MPKYNVDQGFWRHGLFQAVGSVVEMTKAEAKYLGHVISEVAEKTVADVAATPKKTGKKDTPVARSTGVAVEDADGGASN